MNAKELILKTAENLGLTMSAEFVPESKSRNAKQRGAKEAGAYREGSLNWRVTILRDGRAILTTDYSAGIAHCPSYKQEPIGHRMTVLREWIDYECEHGKRCLYVSITGHGTGRDPILPEFADVLNSLALDASVLDCSGFEAWAADYGYDTDSRKAEAMYRECLSLALQLRNGIGEAALANLVSACAEY